MIDSASVTIGRAWDILDQILPAIADACPDIESLTPAGALRRVEATMPRIVVVAVTDDVSRAVAAIASKRAWCADCLPLRAPGKVYGVACTPTAFAGRS